MSVYAEEQTWTGTYEEAKDQVAYLTNEIINIDTQMSIKKPLGIIPNDEFAEYRDWRRRALYARECMRKERAALKLWLKDQVPPARTSVLQDGSLRSTLAAKLDAMSIDYTKNELDNLKRRIAAEMAIDRMQALMREVLVEFGEHDPCGEACGACDLLEQVAKEAR